MQKLNLRVPKDYDMSGKAEQEMPRIRYYCVSEGPTEESYFYGIRNNRVELDIKNDVYIHVIEKAKGQETLSHPMQLINSCLVQMGHRDEDGNDILQENWAKNCKWKDYDPEIDQVCVIFDRDYRNLEKYLDEIFKLCEIHNIQVIMSNPNFELWLLMHFPNMEQYDRTMLLENKKNLRHMLDQEASKNKKYLEILVAKNANGYSKGNKIHFEKFLPLIDNAINQARDYCEDSKLLADTLGTSVGKLIRRMRE